MVGTYIQEERQKQGFSVRQAAKKCQIHPSALSYIERGKRNPYFETVLRIEVGLGLNPGFFSKACLRQ